MKRIAVFQSELGVGGIQKSLVNLLGAIDYDRVQVDLYLSKDEKFWPVEFPEKLNIYYLRPTPRICSFMPFDTAKRMLHYDFPPSVEYDLAIDFNSYQCSCAVGALTVPAKYRVMWIHNDVRVKLENEWKYRVLWYFFKEKFKYYDEFVSVSAALWEPFTQMSGIREARHRVIQNVINVQEIRRKMREQPPDLVLDSGCMNFVALGKLCHQKGYDIMLDAFATASEKRDDLRLYIIGAGPDEAALKAQAAQLKLTGKVSFLGKKSNPYCYMARMDAFVSSSRYEGQPLNIMEARAVGLPLYCTKNLESYTEGLEGVEDLAAALAGAEKQAKQPDDLIEYNQKILDSIYDLTESGR